MQIYSNQDLSNQYNGSLTDDNDDNVVNIHLWDAEIDNLDLDLVVVGIDGFNEKSLSSIQKNKIISSDLEVLIKNSSIKGSLNEISLASDTKSGFRYMLLGLGQDSQKNSPVHWENLLAKFKDKVKSVSSGNMGFSLDSFSSFNLTDTSMDLVIGLIDMIIKLENENRADKNDKITKESNYYLFLDSKIHGIILKLMIRKARDYYGGARNFRLVLNH